MHLLIARPNAPSTVHDSPHNLSAPALFRHLPPPQLCEKSYQRFANIRNFTLNQGFSPTTASLPITIQTHQRFTGTLHPASRPPLSEDHSLAAPEFTRLLRARSSCVQTLIFLKRLRNARPRLPGTAERAFSRCLPTPVSAPLLPRFASVPLPFSSPPSSSQVAA